ncbi:LLM class flavin-dependent oxidoreductase [Streptomyces clavuligerus]|nr:LLM class flavin-dependent oxidoreductase [Streptomyces clavuligerus]ANW18769.1 luciferase [Streptomyces clavuligerus]AXU13335.1 LLM class flavin-dependent oxidoreductase [Streptomyces clavuligerus]EDY47874.1 luciferase family protein [Streptomyces clavuligerus]MBY6303290.1 LLM class flavin-dependent oxidoreductase [Streptomyces clavuligerus]QCS06118.1 LLM class flavin-dependent oxidoreductase [Streptomyces clavuligerus]
MEFGIFVQGYVGRRAETDPLAEHKALMEEAEYIVQADRSGFKYAWATEHHFLEQYSHLSASDVFLGYLAHATDRIHLGSGIFNPLAPVNHPVKVAEKVAMLDHLSEGRFEFGSGRGAGSHEILAFLPGVTDMEHTREIWEETIAEFPKMWLQEEYPGFQGKHWSLPPRKVLPKPYGPAHPALWYAAGSPSSYAMAGRKGLGVLGFSVQKVGDMEWALDAYRTAVREAEPVGAFVNDNVMVTTTAICAETHERAVEIAVGGGLNHLQSLLFRYHDTFPRPEGIPVWPELIPEYTEEIIELLIAEELIICGDPEEVLGQCKRWEQAGADQLSFGLPVGIGREDTMNTIKLLGEHVIPRIDTDPIHRTTRFRNAV